MLNKHSAKQKNNACRMTSFKMVGLVVHKMRKKEVEPIFTDKVGNQQELAECF